MADRAEQVTFDNWWEQVGYPQMPSVGEPPEHAAIARLAWDAALAGARLAAEPQPDDVGMLICGRCGNGPIMPSEIRCGECEPKLNTRCPHCQVWFRPKEWADDNLARVPDPPSRKLQDASGPHAESWLPHAVHVNNCRCERCKESKVNGWLELANASATPAPSERDPQKIALKYFGTKGGLAKQLAEEIEYAVMQEHQSHVSFENELYATLVDPLADGVIKESNMRTRLLESARWYRQHVEDLENQLNKLRASQP